MERIEKQRFIATALRNMSRRTKRTHNTSSLAVTDGGEPFNALGRALFEAGQKAPTTARLFQPRRMAGELSEQALKTALGMGQEEWLPQEVSTAISALDRVGGASEMRTLAALLVADHLGRRRGRPSAGGVES